ncbi:MAG: LPS export ABC transporter periplasmic protein LptC [Candidatus Zixiibacteriota bacterium]|nr:MAG: LPS export ABC transporter periplasmic protein LptC [candidate division Zixibacteria bacterium]
MNRNSVAKILILFLLAVINCGKDESKAPAHAVDVPDQIIENSTITFSEEGVKSATIFAQYVAVYEKLDLKKAKKLHVDFYGEDGSQTSVLLADSGVIREGKQKVEALGNVVVTTQQGVKLITESLRWDPQTAKIVTDDFVTITKGQDVITGYGLEADQELKHFVIKKKVKGEIKDLPKEDLQDSL